MFGLSDRPESQPSRRGRRGNTTKLSAGILPTWLAFDNLSPSATMAGLDQADLRSVSRGRFLLDAGWTVVYGILGLDDVQGSKSPFTVYNYFELPRKT